MVPGEVLNAFNSPQCFCFLDRSRRSVSHGSLLMLLPSSVCCILSFKIGAETSELDIDVLNVPTDADSTSPTSTSWPPDSCTKERIEFTRKAGSTIPHSSHDDHIGVYCVRTVTSGRCDPPTDDASASPLCRWDTNVAHDTPADIIQASIQSQLTCSRL